MQDNNIENIFEAKLDKRYYLISNEQNGFGFQKNFFSKTSFGFLDEKIAKEISKYNIFCDNDVTKLQLGIRVGEHCEDDTGFGLRHILKKHSDLFESYLSDFLNKADVTVKPDAIFELMGTVFSVIQVENPSANFILAYEVAAQRFVLAVEITRSGRSSLFAKAVFYPASKALLELLTLYKIEKNEFDFIARNNRYKVLIKHEPKKEQTENIENKKKDGEKDNKKEADNENNKESSNNNSGQEQSQSTAKKKKKKKKNKSTYAALDNNLNNKQVVEEVDEYGFHQLILEGIVTPPILQNYKINGAYQPLIGLNIKIYEKFLEACRKFSLFEKTVKDYLELYQSAYKVVGDAGNLLQNVKDDELSSQIILAAFEARSLFFAEEYTRVYASLNSANKIKSRFDKQYKDFCEQFGFDKNDCTIDSKTKAQLQHLGSCFNSVKELGEKIASCDVNINKILGEYVACARSVVRSLIITFKNLHTHNWCEQLRCRQTLVAAYKMLQNTSHNINKTQGFGTGFEKDELEFLKNINDFGNIIEKIKNAEHLQGSFTFGTWGGPK